MKKLLALVLALVMVMGLATVGANAAYSDADDITYVEAAEVMTAIGVFDGIDGKFSPSTSLTREQGAKIVAYMLMGKSGADALTASSAPFDDVAADRWSAGSILYCKQAGILGGVGNNKFAPEAPLTGVAFAKMLLNALGYDTAREGLAGGDWQINVVRLVNRINLADGLGSLTYNEAITRDVAAKLAFNTLTKTMVEYVGGSTVSAGDVTIIESVPATDVRNRAYTYETNGNGGAAADQTDNFAINEAGTMQFCENYFPTLKISEKDDAFGVPTDYWYIANSRTDYNRTSAKTVVGTPAGDTVLTYTKAVAVKTIYADLGLASAADIKVIDTDNDGDIDENDTAGIYIDGRAYSTTADAKVAVAGNNGVVTGVDYTNTATGFATITSGNSNKIGGNGVETIVVYDATANEVTIALKNTYVISATADYNTNTKEVVVGVGNDVGAGAGQIAKISGDPTVTPHFDLVTSAKEDDLYLATMTVTAIGDLDAATWTVRTLKPVTNVVVDAAVTGYKATDSVTAAGTKYEYNAILGNSIDDFGYDFYSDGYTMGTGATYDFVLDDAGYVAAIKEHTTSAKMSDYLVLTSVVVDGLSARANALFSDGTTKTITISKLKDDGTTYNVGGTGTAEDLGEGGHNNDFNYTQGKLSKNRFYKFSEDKAGTYTLTAVLNGAQVKAENKAITGGVAKPIADVDKTATGASVLLAGGKVYTGVKNFPDVEASNVTYLLNPSNNAYLLGAYTAKKGTSTTSATDYVFIFDSATTAIDADDTEYYVYSALKNGELIELNVSDDADVDGSALYTIDSYTDGYADVTKLEGTDEGDGNDGSFAFYAQNKAGSSFKVKDGTLTDGTNSYVLSDDCKFYTSDARDGQTPAITNVSASAFSTLNNQYTYNVYGLKASNTATELSIVYAVRVAAA